MPMRGPIPLASVSICDRLRVIVESDVRLYVTPESHPRRGRLNDVVPLIASFIV